MAKRVVMHWYDHRPAAAAIGLFSLLAAFAMANHALDTGSWQQYGITFLLLVIGCNRLVHAIFKGTAKA